MIDVSGIVSPKLDCVWSSLFIAPRINAGSSGEAVLKCSSYNHHNRTNGAHAETTLAGVTVPCRSASHGKRALAPMLWPAAARESCRQLDG